MASALRSEEEPHPRKGWASAEVRKNLVEKGKGKEGETVRGDTQEGAVEAAAGSMT